MTMGSGAFLVQACRYLAERLVEAWENAEKDHPGEVLITPDGTFSEGSPAERLVPADAGERIAIARRVVADRCLYGVDINPMAVEMAKLSLWLITVDRNRPFTFLDHAFKCGDSLLGLSSFKQLENFSLRLEGGKQIAFSTMNLWRNIDEAKKKREALEAMPSDTPQQIAAKVALYAEAEDAVAKLKAAADILTVVELKGLKRRKYDEAREVAADHMLAYWAQGPEELRAYADEQLIERKTLHWPLVFPEIVERGGFDSFIGNPPFMGGQKITGNFGVAYRDYLIASLANNQTGSANLCAYFILRAHKLLLDDGYCGMLAPDTIAQGNTREVCLDTLTHLGCAFPRAISSRVWPGYATVYYAIVWLRKGKWNGRLVLDDNDTVSITSYLSPDDAGIVGSPNVLAAFDNRSFQGTIVLGQGFILAPDKAKSLIDRDPRNRAVIQPFLTGEDKCKPNI
jgi:hypothetical protein